MENINTEALIVYGAIGFVYTVTCSCLSYMLQLHVLVDGCGFVIVLLCMLILDFMFGIQL